MSLNLFDQELSNYREQLSKRNPLENQLSMQFYKKGMDVLNQVKPLILSLSFDRMFVGKNKYLQKDKQDLLLILSSSYEALVNPENNENIQILAELSKTVSGKASPAWKALGATLAAFACLALVVAGVIVAVPSGGTSMLLAAIAATGLSTNAAAAGVAAAGIGGAALYRASRETGLAKSVTEFHSALFKVCEARKIQDNDEAINEVQPQH